MISVVKLTKIYKSKIKKQPPVKALNNVSFDLPDIGMVFITGNSGSGKSTLLNMLGGLDNITKGDIIADGNKFSTFTHSDYDSYRNSYLGFIFQDYCLIEDLTVGQNIELVLDLSRRKDDTIVKTLLNKVYLSNYENRYPRELSGGQKQRVAIARALAKDPQMILADEPTGNLDSKTANQIMKILKELSKTKLVVIVSHNIEDAMRYGDRIIELADGNIIRDEQIIQGFEDELVNEDGNVFLPHKCDYSDDELKTINKWLKSKQISQIKQNKTTMKPTVYENKLDSTKTCENKKSKLSFKKVLSLSGIFLKRRRLGFITTSLILICMFVLLGISQFFVNFNYKSAIDTAIASEGQEVLVGYKGQYLETNNTLINSSFAYEITENELSEIRNCGYNGEVYTLINNSIHISGSSQLLKQELKLTNSNNLANFYMLESYGTLVCNEDYLKERFAIDGQVQYIGNLQDKPYGIIITDYMADSLIYYKPQYFTTREDVLGSINETNAKYNMYVNAIISTDYTTKYADLKEDIMSEYLSKISQGKSSHITSSDEFLSFANYVEKIAGIAYTINGNFMLDSTTYSAKNYTNIDYTYFMNDDLSTEFYSNNMLGYVNLNNPYLEISLNQGEICMSTGLYNKIFGTLYNSSNLSSFEGNELILSKHSRYSNSVTDTPKIKKTLTITQLLANADSVIILNEEDFADFRQVENFLYALYFNDTSNISAIYNVTENNNIHISSDAYNSIKTIISIVKIFKEFFMLFTIGLCVAGILLLCNFGISNIRRRKYEIGVIKAMGGQTIEVCKIFLMQILFVGLCVCLCSTLLLFALSPIINKVLVDSMLYFVNNPNLASISIIDFNTLIIITDITATLLITLVSTMIPLWKLHKIKPVNIIKHKN